MRLIIIFLIHIKVNQFAKKQQANERKTQFYTFDTLEREWKGAKTVSIFNRRLDAAAFEKAVEGEEKSVYLTCLSMLGKREDAQDAMQETMLRAYRSFSDFREQAQVRTWLHRIAVNACIDLIRKRKNVVSLDALRDEGFDVGDERQSSYLKLEESERKRLVNEGLSQLPEEMRAMIVLRDVRGLSYEEVAAVLDLPLGTVKSRISRARNKLAAILLKNAELFDRVSV